jgi:hypothetical protein
MRNQAMKNQACALLAMSIALGGCQDLSNVDEASPTGPRGIAFALDPSYGVKRISISGFSFGPQWEEYNDGGCARNFFAVHDTVTVFTGPPPHSVVRDGRESGCVGGPPAGGPYVGGDVFYSISNSSINGVFVIDGQTFVDLFNVPKDPAGALHLHAVPWFGFAFEHWRVTTLSGSGYFVTTDTMSRPLSSGDSLFHAEFRKLEDDPQ